MLDTLLGIGVYIPDGMRKSKLEEKKAKIRKKKINDRDNFRK